MSDLPSSDRSSALTSIPATPGTPSPQDSISNRRSDTIPETTRPERMARLPTMALDVESPMEAMRATMLQIQQQMQEQIVFQLRYITAPSYVIRCLITRARIPHTTAVLSDVYYVRLTTGPRHKPTH
jgi:hypothetical protein